MPPLKLSESCFPNFLSCLFIAKVLSSEAEYLLCVFALERQMYQQRHQKLLVHYVQWKLGAGFKRAFSGSDNIQHSWLERKREVLKFDPESAQVLPPSVL